MADYIIKCDNSGKPWWIADIEGDPGRTLLEENAQLFPTKHLADKKIEKVIADYPHRKLQGRLKAILATELEMRKEDVLAILKKANCPNWNASDVENALLAAIEYIENESIAGAERFDAEDFLNKKDIWNHPRVTTRDNKESYEIVDLMAEFTNEYIKSIRAETVAGQTNGSTVSGETAGSFKVIKLQNESSDPAPREWITIKEIQESHPKIKDADISLQRIDGTNICCWMVRKRMSAFWNISSDLFLVKS